MPKRPPETVLDYAIAKGGIRKGARVSLFIAQWTIAQQALGHVPTVDEAADWWKENRATWFRRQQEFRQVFDQLDNPAPIATAVIERNGRQEVGQALSALGQVRYGVVGGVIA